MSGVGANLSVDAALAAARERYARRNPGSRVAYESAMKAFPGGSTRSVLYFDPFPLTMVRGIEAELHDVDGHAYIDFVGEYSAGLFGHSDPVIKAAVIEALETGTVMASPTPAEVRLAEAVKTRFPSMEYLRFCNSGTEANLMAIVTAMAFTGRRKILVFREAYHGGVLAFPTDGRQTNVPFDYVLADYNQVDETVAAIHSCAADLAAVIVEPILGAGGNIPGTPEFLAALRAECNRSGAVLIFDEVKTSRCGAGGIQGMLGIVPDMTTLGKYIGGGLPTGAFGGRSDIMAQFDPHGTHPIKHSGTFNNNQCSMMAGHAALTKVFTAARAEEFARVCERERQSINAELSAKNTPMQLTGQGSLWTIHFSDHPIWTPNDIPPVSKKLGQLFHMEMLLPSILVAARGDIFISLPVTKEQMSKLRDATLQFADEYRPLVARALAV